MSTIKIETEYPELHALVCTCAEIIRRRLAQNFVTISARNKDDGETYAITVQRCGGLIPADRIAELEAQVTRLQIEKLEVVEILGKIQMREEGGKDVAV